MLDRRADLAFDICFCVANVPVITVLNEIGVLDRRADLAFHIGLRIANTPVITILNETGVLDRRADLSFHIGCPVADMPVCQSHSGRNCVRNSPHHIARDMSARCSYYLGSLPIIAVENVLAKSITTTRMCL